MSGIVQGLDDQGLPRILGVDARGRVQATDLELPDQVVPLLDAILLEVRKLRTGAVASNLIQDVQESDLL